MKMIILMNSLRYGGANKILIDIANYMADNSSNEIIIVTYTKNSNFYNLNNRIRVSNVFTQYDHLRKVRRLAQLIKLKRIVSKEKPDVVLVFSNIAKLLALYATIFTKTKLIISERIDPYSYKPGKKRTMHLRYFLADGCVFQTQGAASYFPDSIQNKSIIIPNFIEELKYNISPISERNNEIAFIGRFDLKQKRQDIAIKAFNIVLDKYPEMQLSFYGDGPDMEKVEKLALNLGISKNINFYGVVKNINESLLNSKLFIMTSDFEGIPNALMEAMAIGLPVVSTNCSPGGAELLIDDGKNGLLVPTGNFEEMASAILFILDNPKIAERFGNEAKKVKEKYSKEKILPLWEDYILEIVGENYEKL